MRQPILPSFIVLLLLAVPFADRALAGSWSNIAFSADVIRIQTGKTEQVTQGRMYVSPEGIRTETVQFHQPVWMIFKPAQKVVWTLFPDQKTYYETANYILKRPPLPSESGGPCQSKAFICRKVGPERVRERMTTHWKIGLRDEKGTKPHADLWVDARLKLAIIEKYADGLTVRMERIREGRQPPSLFRIPPGFHRMDQPPPEKNQKNR